jgi:hypothetical protein
MAGACIYEGFVVSYYWMSDISTQLLSFAENPLFQVDYNDV